MSSIKPIYEFLLWDNCNNNCKFCYQKQNYHKLVDDQKRISISKVVEFLDSDKFIKGSHVLIVGGEVFDSPTIFLDINNLVQKLIDKMIANEIDLLYINTNLIYKKLDAIEYLLKQVKNNNLFDRLKFTTSYDLSGRFTQKTECLMLNNLTHIMDTYPECKIIVNMMLSDTLCTRIIDRTFSVKLYCDKYKVGVNLIPYIILDSQLAASRNKIFKALVRIDQEIPGYLKSYISNLDLPQDKLLYFFNAKTNSFEFCSSNLLPCGHSENFKRYSSHNTCFICDLKKLFNDYA